MPQTLTDYWELAGKLVSLCEMLVKKLNLMPTNQDDGFYKLRDFLNYFKKTVPRLETLSLNDSVEARNLRSKSHAFQDLGFASRTINTKNKPEIEPQITSLALVLGLSFHQLVASLLVKENYVYQPQSQNSFIGRDKLISIIEKESDETYDDMRKTGEKIGSVLYKIAASHYFKNETLWLLPLINTIAYLDVRKFEDIKDFLEKYSDNVDEKYIAITENFKQNMRFSERKEYTFFYSQYAENSAQFKSVIVEALKDNLNDTSFCVELLECLDDSCLKKLQEILDVEFFEAKSLSFELYKFERNLVILAALSSYNLDASRQKRSEMLLRFAIAQLAEGKSHEIFHSAMYLLFRTEEEKKKLVKELYSSNSFLNEEKIIRFSQDYCALLPKQEITDFQILNALLIQFYLSLGQEHLLTNVLREKKESHQTELSNLFRQVLMKKNCTIELLESEVEKKLISIPDSYRPNEMITGRLYKEFLKGATVKQIESKKSWTFFLHQMLYKHVKTMMDDSKLNMPSDIKETFLKNNFLMLEYRLEAFFENILNSYPGFIIKSQKAKEEISEKFPQRSLFSRKDSLKKTEPDFSLEPIKKAHELYLEIRKISLYDKMLKNPLSNEDEKRVRDEIFSEIAELRKSEKWSISQEDRAGIFAMMTQNISIVDDDSFVKISINYSESEKKYQNLFNLSKDLISYILLSSSEEICFRKEKIYIIYNATIKDPLSSFLQLEQFFIRIKEQSVEELSKNQVGQEIIQCLKKYYHFLYLLRGVYKSFPNANDPHTLYECYVDLIKKANETLNSFKDIWCDDASLFNEKKSLIKQFMADHIKTINKELEKQDNLEKELEKVSIHSVWSFDFKKGLNDESEIASLHEEACHLEDESNQSKRLSH